jgi:hypothetical protein
MARFLLVSQLVCGRRAAPSTLECHSWTATPKAVLRETHRALSIGRNARRAASLGGAQIFFGIFIFRILAGERRG